MRVSGPSTCPEALRPRNRVAMRTRFRRCSVAALAAFTAALWPPGGGAAQGTPAVTFNPASPGCAMAHCDRAQSDRDEMRVPTGAVGVRWRDRTAAGSVMGLGCASNSGVVACSLGGTGAPGPYLKVYNAEGAVLWTAGDLLNSGAYTSAPMVAADGGVVAADSRVVVRFGPAGNVIWSTPHGSGPPVSPTVTENGAVVLATTRGRVAAVDSRTGAALASLELRETIDGAAGRFETFNTPAVRGNRVYVVTEFRLPRLGLPSVPDPDHRGRLYAIDVDPARPPAERLRIAWFFQFGAESGATPTVVGDVIYFDGGRLTPGTEPRDPHFFAVRDDGTAGRLLWTRRLAAGATASAAHDPRGGLWVFARGEPRLVRLAESTGAPLQAIDTAALIPTSGQTPGAHFPDSAMSIARGADGAPVMLVTLSSVGAPTPPKSAFVTAIDLARGALLWKVYTGSGVGDVAHGQFPIALSSAAQPVVVFTNPGGTWGLAAPAG